MPIFCAPTSDMLFILNHVWDLAGHLSSLPNFQEFTNQDLETALKEVAKIHETVFAPLNQAGDKQGCQLLPEGVKTPTGFPRAYSLYQQASWLALSAEPNFGGQGLPHMLSMCVDEMLCAANVSLELYITLTQGVTRSLLAHASEHLKNQYLPKLISGEWSGAMCLTESHSGSDLSLVRTKASLQPDNSYRISGTKIFITSGDHDLTDNIIHLVLARIEGAPAGVKGLSLFLVPKFLVEDNGQLGARNAWNCSAIEHKMGIRASCTCVINYEGATGYLVGEVNAGMQNMFTVMNVERIAIGIQGLGLAEVSYQNALQYAKDRLQGRSPLGAKYPDKIADPIIEHPDVRRMLLDMKSFTEGARALVIWIGKQIDISYYAPDTSAREQANQLVDLFTPIIKAHLTDRGFEACNLGIQILGGHGYIVEWGMEQFVRDARIAQLYEGTNGIQALDLLRRKIVGSKGQLLTSFIAEVEPLLSLLQKSEALQIFHQGLTQALAALQETTNAIVKGAAQDPYLVASVANDYLRLFGVVALAFQWAKMVQVCVGHPELQEVYRDKRATALYYFAHVLPQTQALVASISAGSKYIMQLTHEEFC